jgi:hypothetical protein
MSKTRHPDPAMSFLFSDPPLGGFPDSNLLIGTGFEVGGVYESWGFVVYRKKDYADGRWKLESVATGRTIQAATDRAREVLRREFYEDGGREKCWRCGVNEMAAIQHVGDEKRPVCMDCMVQM